MKIKFNIFCLNGGGTIVAGPVLHDNQPGYQLEPQDAVSSKLKTAFRKLNSKLNFKMRRLYPKDTPLPDSSKVGFWQRWKMAIEFYAGLKESVDKDMQEDAAFLLHGTDSKFRTAHSMYYTWPSIVRKAHVNTPKPPNIPLFLISAIHSAFHEIKGQDNGHYYAKDGSGEFIFNHPDAKYDGLKNMEDSRRVAETLLSSEQFQNRDFCAPVFVVMDGIIYPASGLIKEVFPEMPMRPFHAPGRNTLGYIDDNGAVHIDWHEMNHYLDGVSAIPTYDLDFEPPPATIEVAHFPRRRKSAATVNPTRHPDQQRLLVSIATVKDWYYFDYEQELQKDGLRVMIFEGPGGGNINIDDDVRLRALFEDAAKKGIIILMAGQVPEPPAVNTTYSAGLIQGGVSTIQDPLHGCYWNGNAPMLSVTGIMGETLGMKANFLMQALRQGKIADDNACIIEQLLTGMGDFFPTRELLEKPRYNHEGNKTMFGATIKPSVPHCGFHPVIAQIKPRGAANDNSARSAPANAHG